MVITPSFILIYRYIDYYGGVVVQLSERQEFDAQDRTYKTVYGFTNTKTYVPIGPFDQKVIEEVFDFAFGMSFGGQGHHRNHRTGGNARRENGEIFADTFQGKFSEFALYQTLTENGITVDRSDTDMYGVGLQDNSDFDYRDRKIAVKSTKSFGQLMLLEAEDWNEEGLYVPNLGTGNEFYDYFVLIRLNPYASDLLFQNRLYYTPNVAVDCF